MVQVALVEVDAGAEDSAGPRKAVRKLVDAPGCVDEADEAGDGGPGDIGDRSHFGPWFSEAFLFLVFGAS